MGAAGTQENSATGDLRIERGPDPNANLQDAAVDDKVLNLGAQEGNEAEHSFGFIQGFKTYKRAAFWSIAISTTIVMEGYDVTLLDSFIGYPQFRLRYGEYLNEESGYQISADWQTQFRVLAAVANIIGALLNGWGTARWGHRKVLIVSLFWLSAFIFVVFFAQNIETQLAGQTLCNVPWGVFATTGPSYAAEVTPLAIRPYLTAYVNLCWATGQLISAGVLAGLVDMPNEWSYRIPFALQWVWPIPLAILAYFAPESPWFLVRTNQLDKAKKSLERLSEPSHNVNLDATLAMMVHTDKVEKEERASVSYWECFRGTNLRRTEIACMAFMSQITNGGALCYGGTFFFQQTGIPDNTAYYIGLGGTGIAFIGTCISWLYIHRFGRRIIWLTGFASLTAILWTIGVLASVPQNQGLAWGQSLLCVVWLGAYSMSVGPIVYTIVAEIGSTRLRTHTVVLARSFYYVGNIICGGTLQPRMLSPGAWNWRGRTAFFWAVLATFTFVWGYFRMFETKDRTFGDMDYMFQKKVPARKSRTYVIDEADQFFHGTDNSTTQINEKQQQ
ncbi:maltose permease MAL31 [Sodiomyces alkalinus F11]|uniref:Maltose permease MAL31 n=1 Tax=Sodiomyces alkalinus (strain CBS 110278 / VKM F-3762 / F11) TaxID=1314773 RepID=A0A3N2Q7B3_SODAK|nr:maltose permease MAL31 [Sodiomyces alkalinus F11]ROT42640.1 maltose permease MAL31 [Sodiomyces alkalinus F11]